MNSADQIGPYIGPFLLLIGLTVLAFVLLRKLALWYWRINDVVKYLAEIEFHLRRAPWNLARSQPEAQVSAIPFADQITFQDVHGEEEYLAWSSKKIRTKADLEAFRSDQKK